MKLLLDLFFNPGPVVVSDAVEDILTSLLLAVSIDFFAEGPGDVGGHIVGHGLHGFPDIVGNTNGETHDGEVIVIVCV